jgi:hypothetical protein
MYLEKKQNNLQSGVKNEESIIVLFYEKKLKMIHISNERIAMTWTLIRQKYQKSGIYTILDWGGKTVQDE